MAAGDSAGSDERDTGGPRRRHDGVRAPATRARDGRFPVLLALSRSSGADSRGTGPTADVSPRRLPAERVAAEREQTISVCLPARNEAATIGPILDAAAAGRPGAFDQLVVVDDSTDGTGDIARARAPRSTTSPRCAASSGPSGQGRRDVAGALRPARRRRLLPRRRLGALRPALRRGLAGAVALPGPTAFAKAFYRRPFRVDERRSRPTGGGRVTELTARPLLALLPRALRGPPAPGGRDRRRAATCSSTSVPLRVRRRRRAAHRRLALPSGLTGLAQVDLDVRQNPQGARGARADGRRRPRRRDPIGAWPARGACRPTRSRATRASSSAHPAALRRRSRASRFAREDTPGAASADPAHI